MSQIAHSRDFGTLGAAPTEAQLVAGIAELSANPAGFDLWFDDDPLTLDGGLSFPSDVETRLHFAAAARLVAGSDNVTLLTFDRKAVSYVYSTLCEGAVIDPAGHAGVIGARVRSTYDVTLSRFHVLGGALSAVDLVGGTEPGAMCEGANLEHVRIDRGAYGVRFIADGATAGFQEGALRDVRIDWQTAAAIDVGANCRVGNADWSAIMIWLGVDPSVALHVGQNAALNHSRISYRVESSLPAGSTPAGVYALSIDAGCDFGDAAIEWGKGSGIFTGTGINNPGNMPFTLRDFGNWTRVGFGQTAWEVHDLAGNELVSLFIEGDGTPALRTPKPLNVINEPSVGGRQDVWAHNVDLTGSVT